MFLRAAMATDRLDPAAVYSRSCTPRDPIHKLRLGRAPLAGDPLALQPTISRFENQDGVQELYAMGRELAATVIERHQRRLIGRARRITRSRSDR